HRSSAGAYLRRDRRGNYHRRAVAVPCRSPGRGGCRAGPPQPGPCAGTRGVGSGRRRAHPGCRDYRGDRRRAEFHHDIECGRRHRRRGVSLPMGSTISAQVAGAGADVLAASLRNRSAVARWLAERLATEPETAVTLVAAGERWPDGSLRPAVEDLWGAGAVVSALLSQGVTSMSPEAHTAAAAFDAVRSSIAQ